MKSYISPIAFEPIRHQSTSAFTEHGPFALWLVEQLRPNLIVDIGIVSGFSYFCFCQAVSMLRYPTRCFGIANLNYYRRAETGEATLFDQLNKINKLYDNFSTLKKTNDQVVSDFTDRSIDLLNINGIHTYESLRLCYLTWLPKMSNNGIILFQNITEKDSGVWKFWEEISRNQPHFDFFHGHGLGVLMVGDSVSKNLNELFNADKNMQQEIREAYSNLGALTHSLNSQKNVSKFKLVDEHSSSSNSNLSNLDNLQSQNLALIKLNENIYDNAIALRSEIINNLKIISQLRSRPGKNLVDFLIYKILDFLISKIRNNKYSFNKRILKSYEKRDPNKFTYSNLVFNRYYYLQNNKDVADAKIDPFIHYINNGIIEGRSPSDLYISGQEVYLLEEWNKYIQKIKNELHIQSNLYKEKDARNSKFSIIVKVNEDISSLRALIDSLKNQSYPYWDLHIFCKDVMQKSIITDHFENFDKVKVHNTNEEYFFEQLRNIESDYLLFCGEYEVFLPNFLSEFFDSHINSNADIVYCDFIENGYEDPGKLKFHFLPAFSLELLRASKYIETFSVRTKIFHDIDFSFDLKFSYKFDLILKLTNIAENVVHIPQILFSRNHSNDDISIRNEIVSEDIKILAEHFKNQKKEIEVLVPNDNYFYDITIRSEDSNFVAVIIPTKNNGKLLKKCIESLTSSIQNVAYRIFIIDHQSDEEETLEYLSDISKIHTVYKYEGDFNYSKINNWCVSKLSSINFTHYLFANNDIEFTTKNWLDKMLGFSNQEDVGAVGCLLLYPDNTSIQHAGVCIGMFGVAEHYFKFSKYDNALLTGQKCLYLSTREVSAVTAALLLIKRNQFEKINGFDEKISVGFGDVDLCLRLNKIGLRNIVCMSISHIHHESFTRKKDTDWGKYDPHPNDTRLFKERYADLLQDPDIYSNPNFDSFSHDLKIKLEKKPKPRSRKKNCEAMLSI